jgi:D-inositol-3-phosphate glycosyltransferase
MNIAILSYHTCPLATLGGKDTGGMNVYVRDLTISLGQHGIHVDVFTRSQDEHVPHILHDLGYGNRIVHIPAGPEIPRSKKELLGYLPEFVTNILKFQQKKNIKYDLIHSHYWLSGLAAINLRSDWNIPTIHMFHTLAKLKNQIAQNETEKEGNYRINGEEKVVHAADKIVSSTPIEKAQLISHYCAEEEKIKIIPPGVDTGRFYPIPPDEAKEVVGIPTDGKIILFVGRIEPLKGVDNLIRAIASIRKSDVLSQCPHYLIIIGGNPDPDSDEINNEMRRLKKLCKELGLDDLIIFLGKKAQDTLPYYYSASEVVVMPSYYESFGMVALESMACGTPVLATQVGGLAYLVKDGETGFTIPVEDPQALEQKLTMLICKTELREEMSHNSIIYAQSFSWEKITPQIIELYKNTISSY